MTYRHHLVYLFLAIFASGGLFSCAKPLDDNTDDRNDKQELCCNQMNINLSSLSQIVNALQDLDYVTSLSPCSENGRTTGYVLTFSRHGSVTIYSIMESSIPMISIARDSDDNWYWTLNGSWLVDQDKAKLSVNGTSPKLKTEESDWYVSYDEGKTWTNLGQGYWQSVFKKVKEDDHYVYLTLAHDNVIDIPKEQPLSVAFDANDLVVMCTSDSRDIHYTVSSPSDAVEVTVAPSSDLQVKVIPEEDARRGCIHVETGETIDENTQLLVFISDGLKTITQVIHFELQELTVKNAAEYWTPANACEITLSFLTNTECRIDIPEEAKSWISESQTKAVQEKRISLSLAKNPGTDRVSKVWVETTDGRLRVEYIIRQDADPEVRAAELQHERDVLEKWYRDCNGGEWIQNENWCSDEPLNKWSGVYTKNGHVWWISLPNNKMEGKLPEEVWGLDHLEHLYIPGNNLEIRIPDDPDKLSSSFTDVTIGNYSNAVGRNHLVGGLPHSMAKFKNLISFHASCMEIDGTIPDEIWSLPELGSLCLGYNRLEGELSPAIGNAKKLWQLDLPSNRLSGPIPEAFGEMENLEEVLLGNTTHHVGFDFELECNNFTRLPESIGKLDRMYTFWMQATGLEGPLPDSFYDCDILQNIQLNNCRTTAGYMNRLGELSERLGELTYLLDFNAQGAGLEGCIPRSLGNLKYVSALLLGGNNLTGNLPEELADATTLTTFWANSNRLSGEVPERIMNCEQAGNWILEPQQPGYGLTFNLPESTDYSRDGMVHELQCATKGKGIDVVLLGDAFGDTELADGTYERTMRQVADHFFELEPYAGFKDYFNVYVVDVVSANNCYAPGAKRALSTQFGDGTHISGDDAKCFAYAQKAVGDARMDEVLVVVTLNRKYYAGTCYMYHYNGDPGDYGSGPAIAYFPLGTDADMFRGLVQHEAAGHGFAKLDDEYDYGAAVSQAYIDDRVKSFDWGWWANIDLTGNPETVKWARFLSDSRYADEGLGVFEGGGTFGTGVWRPTENSIMRYNTGIYNAPSREAIYKRINKLAYGSEWQYDYETFVEQDLVGRTTTKASWNNWRRYDPLEKPVVTGKSWREASGAPVEEDNTPRKRNWSKTIEAEVVTAYAKNVCMTMQNDVLTATTTAPEENRPIRSLEK